jgi:hypothetical protein
MSIAMGGTDAVSTSAWTRATQSPRDEGRGGGAVKDETAPLLAVASPAAPSVEALGQKDFELAGRLAGGPGGSIDQLAGVPALERKPLSGGPYGIAAGNPYSGMIDALRTAALRRDAAAVVAARPDAVAPAVVSATSSPAAIATAVTPWTPPASNGFIDPNEAPAVQAPVVAVPAEGAQTDPDPQGGSTGDPGTGTPDPAPDPTPAPDPEPTQGPTPTSDPEPAPDPDLAPEPDPAPDPEPTPPPATTPPTSGGGSTGGLGSVLGGLFGHH